jgi:hypothetical protein
VIIGAHGNAWPAHGGRAYLYLGSSSGLASSPDWVAEGGYYSFFGQSVGTAGDVNGDGYEDVLVTAHGDGRAYAYLGSPTGLPATPSWTVEEDAYSFGFLAASAGDVNGDGFDDAIITAPSWGLSSDFYDAGRVFGYLGSPSGLSATAVWVVSGTHSQMELGRSGGSLADADGDGYDDVLLGASGYTSDQAKEGAVLLYRGSSAGLELDPAWLCEGNQDYAYLGESVASAGDVDGDGHNDIAAGAYKFDGGDVDEGEALVYLGSGCEEIGTKYCLATSNSTGSPAEIEAWCSGSVAAGSLRLQAEPVPDQFGLFFHGATQVQLAFGNGYLCVADDMVRGAVIHPWSHFASYHYDNSDAGHDLAAYVGTTRHFQYWFRDPVAGGAYFNTSNAVSVVVLP